MLPNSARTLMGTHVPPRSPIRKRAFIVAAGTWALAAVWFVVLFQLPPQQWPTVAVAVATALSAAATAIMVVELLRSMAPRLTNWTDQIHLRWVIVCAVLLFAIQFAGISMVTRAYGS